jgi:hypothetical protein
VYAFQYDAFIQRFVTSLLDISKLSRATQDKLLEVKLEEILFIFDRNKWIDFLNLYYRMGTTINKNLFIQ